MNFRIETRKKLHVHLFFFIFFKKINNIEIIMNTLHCSCENNLNLDQIHDHMYETTDENEKIVLYGYDPNINKNNSSEKINNNFPQIKADTTVSSSSLYNYNVPDYPIENFIFGMVNIKKMLIAPIYKCFENHNNVVLEIESDDFLYPITFVDNQCKTNNNVPFLYSVDSLIHQLTSDKEGKKFIFVAQFFVENCMYHASFKLENICNVPGYQVILFTKMLSGADDLYKLFQKLNGCNKKIEAYGICMSFYLSGGKIMSPCSDHKKKKVKKVLNY
jgi:hypothetical protein